MYLVFSAAGHICAFVLSRWPCLPGSLRAIISPFHLLSVSSAHTHAAEAEQHGPEVSAAPLCPHAYTSGVSKTHLLCVREGGGEGWYRIWITHEAALFAKSQSL